ncbi:MAG: hydroxylamine reductase [Candidatus Bathyarchaeota archaeon]
MFCFQCEQTAGGKGCTTFGVCGKNPEVAALQDLLIYMIRELSHLSLKAKNLDIKQENIDPFICEAVFTTITNVNFDPDILINYIQKTSNFRDNLKEKILAKGNVDFKNDLSYLVLGKTKEDLINQGKKVGIKSDPSMDTELVQLQWLLIYGLKGVSAYAHHAYRLGKQNKQIFDFIKEAFAATLDKSLNKNDIIQLALRCGEINIRTMELLDAANTETYGDPIPTKVPLGHKKGKAILVSGHDLKDLHEILKQTVNKGIYVYTHGEMLPAHSYPKLKKYPHFYGHFGTAWQNQQKQFKDFPGAILMTTNCLQKPQNQYKDNIFTSGPVRWPGIPHVAESDFSAVIKKALEMPGFTEDKEGKAVNVGFGRNHFLSLVPKITELIMTGKVNSFFLVAGCDGAKPGRNYYTEFVEKTPKDSLVLTLACGKFRFFDKEIGEIAGIPRLLDMGQCNDAYSAIKVAQAFGEIFNSGINELPLFFIISWYEQKAVAILLSLFYLGIKNIHLGPSFPAFITPNLLKKFNVLTLKTPEVDLKEIIDYVNGVSEVTQKTK